MNETPQISLDTMLCRTQEIVSADLDGDMVMMSIEQGKYYGMDSIGSRIWALLETPLTVSALCDLLLEEYEVSREHCEQEVLTFLNDLAKEKLLEVEDVY